MVALAIALTLVPPVPGGVARAFDYAGDPFAPGHHRGVDIATRPGDTVRAACAGRVTFAARAGANGGAVTVRCGAWSVTHLPLRELATRAGDSVTAGEPIGAAAASRNHAGLHLGVRRADDRLGYVDPAPLLRTPAPPIPPAAAPRRPAGRPHGPPPPHPAPSQSEPAPRTEPVARTSHAAPAAHAVPAARATPASRTAPAPPPRPPAARPGSSPLAPWPAWAGLALLLCGAIGAGTARAARNRRASSPARGRARGTVSP